MDTLTSRQKFCLSQIEKYGEANPCYSYFNNTLEIASHLHVSGKAKLSHSVWIDLHGFGYEKINGKWVLIPHSGKIIIEDNVYIHAYTTICHGTGDNDVTRIGNGTKIDTHCHVAHNVKIGKNCLITSGVIIGGSAEIGNDVYIGIGALIRNKVKIGDGAVIGMGAVVVDDVPPGVTVVGNPAKIFVKK